MKVGTDIDLEQMFKNISVSDISDMLINLNKFQLNSKKHIKKYNKLRNLHCEIIDSMENYILSGKYDMNMAYKPINSNIGKKSQN